MFQEYSLSLRKRKDEIWNSKTILDGFSVMPTFTRHALDLLIYKGYEFMLGPNGTMKMAFEDGLILDHDNWRKMAKSRNTLSHVYDEDEVKQDYQQA